MPASNDRVLRFHERLDACERRGPNGAMQVDIDCIGQVVADDLEAAERFVEFHCRQAPNHPGYLRYSFLVALAARDRHGNSRLMQLIVDTLNELEGWDEFYEAISPFPAATEVGQQARRAATAWWQDNPEAELLCSECREAIPASDGYLTRRTQKRGRYVLRLGKEHLCENCFRRWLGRVAFGE